MSARITRAVTEAWRARQLPFYIAPILFVIAFTIHVVSNDAGISVTNAVHSLSTIFSNSIVLIAFALGAGIVLASGEVDLSLPGLAALSAVIFVYVVESLSNHLMAGIVFAFLAVGIIGTVSGCILGYLVARFKTSSLIASWAIGVIWLNLAMYVSVWCGGDASGISTLLLFNLSMWAPLGHGPIVSVAGIALFFALMATTRLPGMAAAVGANEKSAKYLGLQVNAIKISCFITSGVLAALGGVISVSWNLGKASVGSFRGLELAAIAIAVLGGTAMSGGYLRLWAILLGALCWQTIAALATHFNFQITQGVPEGHEWVFALLVLAVAFLVSSSSGKDMIRVYIKK